MSSETRPNFSYLMGVNDSSESDTLVGTSSESEQRSGVENQEQGFSRVLSVVLTVAVLAMWATLTVLRERRTETEAADSGSDAGGISSGGENSQ